MNKPESMWSSQPSFEATYKEIADYYHEHGLQLHPLYTQDGSEIHSKLTGTTFNFWGIPGSDEGKIAVNFEGVEDEDSIQLTGGVYDSFSDAKEALRKKAREIYKEEESDFLDKAA